MSASEKRAIALWCSAGTFLISGIMAILDGTEITNFSRSSSDVPNWIIILTGSVLVVAGTLVLQGDNRRWNLLLGSLITSSLGILFAWIAVFADDAGFRRNWINLYDLTGIPDHRIGAALCSILCFFISYVYIKSLVKNVA